MSENTSCKLLSCHFLVKCQLMKNVCLNMCTLWSFCRGLKCFVMYGLAWDTNEQIKGIFEQEKLVGLYSSQRGHGPQGILSYVRNWWYVHAMLLSYLFVCSAFSTVLMWQRQALRIWLIMTVIVTETIALHYLVLLLVCVQPCCIVHEQPHCAFAKVGNCASVAMSLVALHARVFADLCCSFRQSVFPLALMLITTKSNRKE